MYTKELLFTNFFNLIFYLFKKKKIFAYRPVHIPVPFIGGMEARNRMRVPQAKRARKETMPIELKLHLFQ